MKPIILTIASLFIFILGVHAQDKRDTLKSSPKLTFSIGLEEGIPLKTVAKYSSFVSGASLQAEYKVLKELGITSGANYRYFIAKEGGEGLSLLPVMAGVKFYVIPGMYLAGQAGVAFYIGDNGGKDTYMTYSQGIGYKVSSRIDLMAKYESSNMAPGVNYSFLGLRAAYTFW